jgi:hypothetical protein
MTEEATIKVRRKLQPFLAWGRAASLGIFADNAKIGTIRNDQDVRCQLLPGSHSVVIKAWGGLVSKPIQLNLSSGDVRNLECGYLRPNVDLLDQSVLAPLYLLAVIQILSDSSPALFRLIPQPSLAQIGLASVAFWIAIAFVRAIPGIALYVSESRD